MIVKIKNLYVYWLIFSVLNIASQLIGLFRHPLVETLAMCYGALTFLATYHLLTRLGIFTEHKYVRADEQGKQNG